MALANRWCEGCQKNHESGEECPKGWQLSFFDSGFVSPEDFKEEVIRLKNFINNDKN